MTKRPLVHLHRSQSSRCWTGPHKLSQSRGHFTFDNFWLPQCARKLSGSELPWQLVATADVVIFWQAQKDVWFYRYWPKGGRERGNGGNWAMEMKKRHVAGSTADKGRHVQSLFIPFSLLGCFKKKFFFFFKYLPKWEPHKHFFDSDFVITETLLDHICLNDGQTRVFFSLFCFFCQSERRGLSFGERQNERITLRGEARTNEWAKKDKMEWSSIKRLAVISSSPPSPLALMS